MIPKQIYHYTNIDALACVLKFQTLRFSRLSDLNDPLEGKTNDIKNAEKLVYNSSWTISSEDTIPMWKMYTNLKGVRLKVNPNKLFLKTNGIEKMNMGGGDSYLGSKLQEPIRIDLNNVPGFIKTTEVSHILGPDMVNYVEQNQEQVSVLKDMIMAYRDGPITVQNIELHRVGLRKNKHWGFENEARFRIPSALSFSPDGKSGITSQQLINVLQFKNQYLDVRINPEVFENAEIMLAPKCDISDEIIVNSLINEFAPSIKITKSGIKIR